MGNPGSGYGMGAMIETSFMTKLESSVAMLIRVEVCGINDEVAGLRSHHNTRQVNQAKPSRTCSNTRGNNPASASLYIYQGRQLNGRCGRRGTSSGNRHMHITW